MIPLALSRLCGVLTVQLQDSSCKAAYLFVSSPAIATGVSRCSHTDLSPDGCVTGDSNVSLWLLVCALSTGPELKQLKLPRIKTSATA